MRVKSYEEAVSAVELSEKDIKSNEAFVKLTHIIKALNGKWVVDWFDRTQPKYCIYFYIRRAPFVGGAAYYGATAGPVYVYTSFAASTASTHIGSRLCFKSAEDADFVIETFPELLRDLFAGEEIKTPEDAKEIL